MIWNFSKILFWTNYERGIGSIFYHLIFPSVFEIVKRRGYKEETFHLFFNSMRLSLAPIVCASKEDILRCKEGITSVMVDVLLPILCEEDNSSIHSLRQEARSLVSAVQFTKLIRDMKKDKEQDRVYLYNVEEEHPDSIEKVLVWIETYYNKAESGMLRLPPLSQTVLGLFMNLERAALDNIRSNDYDVTNPNIVSLKTKALIAKDIMTFRQWIRLLAGIGMVNCFCS